MSIAKSVIRSNVLSTSTLKGMFGLFCCRIFAYRDNILSPVKDNISAQASQDQSATAALSTTDATTSASATTSQVQPQAQAQVQSMVDAIENPNDPKGIHHNISMILKSITDSENVSSFKKSTKEILYAMVAIADEVFLNMDWSGRHYWEENMLENRFFNSQIAGEEIFNRINDLLAESDPLSLEKAEIYLNMLSLGFQGKFRGVEEGKAEINLYRSKLYDFITKHSREDMISAEYRIFQKEYTFTMPTIRRKLLPDGAIITYLSSFFIIMFLSISTMAWLLETKDLHKLLNDISEIALREH